MRRKNQKGKRWYELASSTSYAENFVWREFQKAIRKVLGDEALPRGLPSEEYLQTRVDRLRRYNKYLNAQLCFKQPAIEQKHKTASEPISEVAELPLDPNILIVSSLVLETLIRDLAKRPGDIRAISHRAFEELIANIFERF